jgi:hypothetical protein
MLIAMRQRQGTKKAATTLVMSAVAVITSMVVAAPAYASADIGWTYSPDNGAKGWFDADVAGWTGAEEITACDVKSDGYAAAVYLFDGVSGNMVASVRDTGNDGSCTSRSFNMVTDERAVRLKVCTEYTGGSTCRLRDGVS